LFVIVKNGEIIRTSWFRNNIIQLMF